MHEYTKNITIGVIEITPDVHGDERGFFKEIIHPKKLAAIGINHRFVQVNHSRSKQWTWAALSKIAIRTIN